MTKHLPQMDEQRALAIVRAMAQFHGHLFLYVQEQGYTISNKRLEDRPAVATFHGA